MASTGLTIAAVIMAAIRVRRIVVISNAEIRAISKLVLAIELICLKDTRDSVLALNKFVAATASVTQP